jgi:prefoldin subunit 5
MPVPGQQSANVVRELPEPLQAEIPSIEDLQEVVEKLRKELNEVREAQETDVEDP